MGIRLDMGRWGEVRRLMPEAEATVDANAATPCVVGATALLCGAIAHANEGDLAEARRLEVKAEGLGFEGYDHALEPLRLHLALAYGNIARVRELIPRISPEWLTDQWTRITLLDGLIAVGDIERLESEAVDWVIPGTYIEPFALRSLGVVRNDPRLIDQAVSRFEAMGVAWYADETRRLRGRLSS